MRLLLFLGNACIAFLDFSAGAALALMLGQFLHYPIGVFECFMGGVLALAPDCDFLYMLLRQGNLRDDHHQYVTHRPVVGVSVAVVLGVLIGGPLWAVVASVCVFWHYLHDTQGFGGTGIAWFWPFSKKYISVQTGVSVLPKPPRLHHHDHRAWLLNVWLTPNATSIRELGIGSALFAFSAGYVLGWRTCLALLGLFWICVGCAWLALHRRKTRLRRKEWDELFV